MEQDILKRQAQDQPSGGRLGGVMSMLGRLRPKGKPTSPDALVKRGMDRPLGKSPLTGQPMSVGTLYGLTRSGPPAAPSGEVPAEVLVIVDALERGSTLDTLAVDTEMSPTQVNVGLAYLKGRGIDLSAYR